MPSFLELMGTQPITPQQMYGKQAERLNNTAELMGTQPITPQQMYGGQVQRLHDTAELMGTTLINPMTGQTAAPQAPSQNTEGLLRPTGKDGDTIPGGSQVPAGGIDISNPNYKPPTPASPSAPTTTTTTTTTAPSATPSGSVQAGVARSAAPANTAGRVISPEGYTLRGYTAQEAPELQYYRAQAEQVGNVYDAARDAQLRALENQYNMSRAESQRAAEQIPQAYQQQALAAEQQAARDRLAFNEQAAASGLNVGAGSQAQLAQNAALQGNLASIGTARANAEAEAQFQLMQMERQYQNAVSEALANNEYERAAALMQEYQREAQSTVEAANQRALLNFQEQQAAARSAQETANAQAALDYELRRQNMTDAEKRAATLAQYGDFSGYGELGYSPAEQAAMRQAWIAQNPDIAAAMGYVRRGGGGGSPQAANLDSATQNMINRAIAEAQKGNENYLQNVMAMAEANNNGTLAATAYNAYQVLNNL